MTAAKPRSPPRRLGNLVLRAVNGHDGTSCLGQLVDSDGWPGFAVLAAAGHVHQVTRTSAVLTGQTRKRAADNPTFRWLNTLLGNLKTSLRGTFHAIAPRYAPRYLAQAQYRFNRRYTLEQILPRLAERRSQNPTIPL